jgi:hypothetical protein
MGKLLMLREEDDARIVRLKRRLKAKSKVDVVRMALDVLERQETRAQKIARWKRAARLVAASGSSREFWDETEDAHRESLDRLP